MEQNMMEWFHKYSEKKEREVEGVKTEEIKVMDQYQRWWEQIQTRMYVKSESESVSHSVMSDSAIAQTVASQAPLSMEFSRQEYWNGLPFLSPGDLSDPGTEPRSHALQADSLLSEPAKKSGIYLFKPKTQLLRLTTIKSMKLMLNSMSCFQVLSSLFCILLLQNEQHQCPLSLDLGDNWLTSGF